jgi:uncharacterized protein
MRQMAHLILSHVHDPALVAALTQASTGFEVAALDAATADVVAYLTAQQPRLIVIELNSPGLDWEAWIMSAKVSPATRKMPVLAIGPDIPGIGLHPRARKAGADVVVEPGAFAQDAAALIAKHARPDESAEILRQSQLPLPELAQKAIAEFNARDFWEQHETFEHVWKDEPGPIRQMYQGILQVGVAYLQIQRKNFVGARKLFQRARQYLGVLPDVSQGVDIRQLRDDAQAAQEALEALGPERVAEFPDALFKPIRLVSYHPPHDV